MSGAVFLRRRWASFVAALAGIRQHRRRGLRRQRGRGYLAFDDGDGVRVVLLVSGALLIKIHRERWARGEAETTEAVSRALRALARALARPWELATVAITGLAFALSLSVVMIVVVPGAQGDLTDPRLRLLLGSLLVLLLGAALRRLLGRLLRPLVSAFLRRLMLGGAG